MTAITFFEGMVWFGYLLAISGAIGGFIYVSKNDIKKRYIVITLSCAVCGLIIAGFAGSAWNEERDARLENNYQSLKPALDIKSCDELEKIISFGTNQTMTDFAKRNYNERCIIP